MIDLTESPGAVPYETVLKASDHQTAYGTNGDLENCLWSAEMLFKSMEPDLLNKVMETYSSLPVNHRSGMVAFKLMMDRILPYTHTTIRTLQSNLRALKVSDFNGENVVEFVSMARGITGILQGFEIARDARGIVPPDLFETLAEGLRQCSNEDFTTAMTTLQNNHT